MKTFGKVMLGLWVFVYFVFVGHVVYFLVPLRGEIGGFYLGAGTNFADVRGEAGVTLQIDGQNKRVLVLTDFHIMGMPLGVDGRTRRFVRQLVDEVRPELIFLLGDNVATFFNHNAQRFMIRFMDEFGVPWAPLFGNHDGHGKADKEYLSQMLMRDSVYSIFR